MRESTRRILAAVTRSYPCVVISGRARGDVERWVGGLGMRELIGNHGIEPWQASHRLAAEVRNWRPRLEKELSGLPGVWIEDKGYSLAIHYRRSRTKKAARAAILAAIASLGESRVLGGKQVVNLLPVDAPHKGIALERARARLRCDTAVYVGDDETDEDVFALDQPGRLLTIRVGKKRDSLATYCLHNQREIDALLACFVGLRPESTSRTVIA
jgi:trehalose 6-phosphate phosphatase